MKALILKYLESEVSSTSIDIVCMPGATGGLWLYYNFIICKWQSNGMDYCDTITTANNDCKSIGYMSLDTLFLIGTYSSTDQVMKKHYIDSSSCGR
jgi:hypothetical protein